MIFNSHQLAHIKMIHFYHQGCFQLKTLGYVTHKSSTLHNIPSLLVCKLRSPFIPNWKEMPVSRNPGVSLHSQWCTRCMWVSCLEVSIVHNALLGLSCWSLEGCTSSDIRRSGFSIFTMEEPPPWASYQMSQSCLSLTKGLVSFTGLSSCMVLLNPDWKLSPSEDITDKCFPLF